MIKVKDLTKTYSSKNGVNCKALDNINFCLEDKGIVFIIGKSGSGKSTFLNILGGLDSATSGSVFVDGNDITSFDDKSLENYRNTYLGFIFQEFFLIDSLNVFENVKLALDLQNIQDDNLVYETLDKVGLKSYAKKYPRQLSGGEKQRVAIARAIVKKPKLLLADELTGNLDVENSKIVLEILRKLSKEMLIIVVSHNNDDANLYADRKIELSDGKLILDVTKIYNEEIPLIDDKYINIPTHRKITLKENEQINDALKTGKYKFRQLSEGFIKTNKEIKDEKTETFSPSKMSIKNTIKYSYKFSKGNIGNSIATTILLSILLVLMFVCNVFESTNVPYLVNQARDIYQNEHHVLIKATFPNGNKYYIEHNHTNWVTEEDIDSFYKMGYEGKIYKLYSGGVTYDDYFTATIPGGGFRKFYTTNNLPYVENGSSVLECDIDFLNKQFGNGNKVKVLAGSLDNDFRPYGLVITDYAADCIHHLWKGYQQYNKEEAYQKIIEDAWFKNNATIKAIIDTDYEEKYTEIFDLYDKLEQEQDDNKKIEINNKIKQLNKTDILLQEIFDYLAVAYYINTSVNYVDGFFHEDNTNNTMTFQFRNLALSSSNMVKRNWLVSINSSYPDLKPGEIVIPVNAYNILYGTDITFHDQTGFEEKEIDFNLFVPWPETTIKTPLLSMKLKVVGVQNTHNSYIYCCKEDLIAMSEFALYPHTLYFDNVYSILQFYIPNSLEYKEFMCSNLYYEAAYELNEIISMLKEVFIFVILGVALVAVILISSYTNKTISRKKKDIGIYKAIGGSDKQYITFFTFQLLSIILSIISIVTLIISIFKNLFNSIFVTTVANAIDRIGIKSFVVIRFDINIILIYLAILLLLVFITSLISIKSFKKIKPINIIRNSR